MSVEVTLELLWVQSLQVTAVGLAVWLIVHLFAGDRPHLAHALWTLVLLKCVTPPVWTSPVSPFHWSRTEVSVATEPPVPRPTLSLPFTATDASKPAERDGAFLKTRGFEIPVTNTESSNAVSSPERSGYRVSWQTGLVFGWAFGAGVFIVIAVGRWLLLQRMLWQKTVSTPEGLDELALSLARRLGVSPRVRVRVLDSPIGPAVTGCFRPVILLPRFDAGFGSIGEIEPLMAHELIHFRRGDVGLTLLQTVAKSVLWFHPLAWLASNRLSRSSTKTPRRGSSKLLPNSLTL